MSKINVEKIIEQSRGNISARYDIGMSTVNDVLSLSRSSIDLVCNSFRFGYMQGLKAARAEMKKGGVANG